MKLNWLLKIPPPILALVFAGALTASALPQDYEVVAGNVSVESTDSALSFSAQSNKAIINFDSFDIGPTETVNFYGPESEVLARVTGGQASVIEGNLYSDLLLLALVNPSGIHVTPTGSIDASNLVLSTRDITDSNFISGDYIFEKLDPAQQDMLLLNEGEITISDGGFGVLIAGAIENKGIITAQAGTIALAGGDAMTLSLGGNGLISIAIDMETASTILDYAGNPITDQIKNSGTLNAPGGMIILKAESLTDLFQSVINLDGYVMAEKFEGKDGQISIVANGKVTINTELYATKVDIEASSVGGTEGLVHVRGEYLQIETPLVDINSEANITHIIVPDGDITVEEVIDLEGVEIVTIIGSDFGKVTYIKSNNITLETPSGDVNTSPGVVISGNEVKVSAQRIGSYDNPVGISANITYINRIQGTIDILEMWGLGSTITIRGPDPAIDPSSWGGVSYNDTSNLVLDAENVAISGSLPLYLYGNITFSSLEITTPGKEIYFEIGKTYSILGNTKIQGAATEHIKLLIHGESETETYWYIDPRGDRDINYTWVEDSYNVNPEKIIMLDATNRGNSPGWDPMAIWTGAVNAFWSDPGNWTGLGEGVIPGGGDTVLFDGTSQVNSTIDQNTIIESLTIEPEYTGILTISANLATNGGQIEMNCAVVLAGDVALDTTNAGAYAGGDIIFGGTLDSDGAATQRNLQLTAGTGNIRFSASVGSFADLSRNALSYWDFSEGSGDITYDTARTGNNNDGTLTDPDNMWTSEGKDGNALIFDGSADYVQKDDVTGSLNLNYPGMTWSAWVKVSADRYNPILNIGYYAGTGNVETNDFIYTVINADGTLHTRFYDWGIYDVNWHTTETIPVDTWTQVTVTHINGEDVKHYINGELVPSTLVYTGSDSKTKPIQTSPSDFLRIGGNCYATPSGVLQGTIDDVGIWDRALDSSEVELLYARGGALGDITITSAGNIQIDSAVNAASHDITLSGDWINAGGDFNAGEGSVTFNGVGVSQVLGTTSFKDLICTTSGKTLIFDTVGKQTIDTLTLTGSVGSMINIESTTPGIRAEIDVTNSDVEYVTVSDSYNSNAAIILARNSADFTNNAGWSFIGEGSMIIWTGAVSDLWSDFGNWHTGTVPTAGDGVIFDGDILTYPGANAASTIDQSFTIYSLTIDGYTGTITQNADLSVRNSYSQSSGTFDASSGLGDINVGGNVTVTGGTLSAPGMLDDTSFVAGGDWEISGTGSFLHNDGRVVLNGEGTLTLTSSGTTSFYDVHFRNDETVTRILQITIDNSTGAGLADFQVPFVLSSDNFDFAYSTDDGRDLRFYASDGVTELSYWVESWDQAGETATVWVKVPSIPAEGTTVSLKFGNSGLVAASDADATFNFFEDFAGTVIDDTKFSYGGGTITQNEYVSIVNNADGWDAHIFTSSTTTRSSTKVFQAKFNISSGTRSMIGWHDGGTGVSYADLVYALYLANGAFHIYEDGTYRGEVGSFSTGVWYDVKVELKSPGAQYYYKPVDSSSWTLLYNSAYSSEASLRMGIAHYDSGQYTYTDNWTLHEYASADPTSTFSSSRWVKGDYSLTQGTVLNVENDMIVGENIYLDPVDEDITVGGDLTSSGEIYASTSGTTTIGGNFTLASGEVIAPDVMNVGGDVILSGGVKLLEDVVT